MQITDTAVRKIKGNNQLIARLMIVFDRGQRAIETWLVEKDSRLTTDEAVEIIAEETRLTRDEILEDGTVRQDSAA